VVEEREFINYRQPCLSSFLPLDGNEENRFREVEEKKKEIVLIDTIDKFLAEKKIEHVDLLKVDTQGFDLDVILGAKSALCNQKVDYILIELNFVKMYQNQCKAEEVIKYLNENGLYLIDYYEKVRQKNVLAWCTALFGRR